MAASYKCVAMPEKFPGINCAGSGKIFLSKFFLYSAKPVGILKRTFTIFIQSYCVQIVDRRIFNLFKRSVNKALQLLGAVFFFKPLYFFLKPVNSPIPASSDRTGTADTFELIIIFWLLVVQAHIITSIYCRFYKNYLILTLRL